MHLSDHAADLPRYRGLSLPDRQDWLVCPCGQNRDSEPLDESNFAASQRILDAAGVEYEVHQFGHWACGWFEIILVHPDGAETVASIACRLANYPALDEEDLIERESEAERAAWESYGRNAFVEAIAKDFELQPGTVDWLKCDGRAFDGLRELQSYHAVETGDYRAPDIARDELASLIRQWRKVVS